MNGISAACCRFCYWNVPPIQGETEKDLEAGKARAHMSVAVQGPGDSTSQPSGQRGRQTKSTGETAPEINVRMI
jgi:hypothetical protein